MCKMKTIDRYIVKNFLIAALLCFVALMAIRILADLFFNMDEFTKSKGVGAKTLPMVLGQMGSYYGYKSLAYFRELGGVIIVAAAAFTLARMNHTNELTAILASGVSLHRVLLPIVICAAGLNLLVLVDSEVLIPRCKEQLVRDRDDVGSSQAFQVRLMTDDRNSSWFSRRFVAEAERVDRPLIVLRDQRYKRWGHIAGPSAAYDSAMGGWVFASAAPADSDEAPEHPRLHIGGALAAADTTFIPTGLGPAEMIGKAQDKVGGGDLDWEKVTGIRKLVVDEPGTNEEILPAGNLRIRAQRLGLNVSNGKALQAELAKPEFIYTGSDGKPLAKFVAEGATYRPHGDPRRRGWLLYGGKLVYLCDLTPGALAVRKSSDWMQYMSSSELGRLLRLGRVGDKHSAKLIRHSRFGDFFNNIILLLVGVPFILSRERNVKASAGLTVLTVGGAYICIYLSRYIGLPPMLAAWMPIIVVGAVAGLVLDAVKT